MCSSLRHVPPFHQVSNTIGLLYLSYYIYSDKYKQTNIQTDPGKNITVLVEVLKDAGRFRNKSHVITA